MKEALGESGFMKAIDFAIEMTDIFTRLHHDGLTPKIKRLGLSPNVGLIEPVQRRSLSQPKNRSGSLGVNRSRGKQQGSVNWFLANDAESKPTISKTYNSTAKTSAG